ncbi:MAG: phosphotransferase [Candidatus Omnitrophota bacterium]
MSYKRSKSILFRLLAWSLVLTQAMSSAAYADIKEVNEDAALATQSIFQRSSPDRRSSDPVSSDMRARAVAISVWNHYFRDRGDASTLSRAMHDQFRNDPSYLEGVDLGGIRLEGESVFVPFEFGGKSYMAACSPAGQDPEAGTLTHSVQVTEIKDGPKAAPAGPITAKGPAVPGQISDLSAAVKRVVDSPILVFDVDMTLNRKRNTVIDEEAAELLYQLVVLGKQVRVISGRSLDEFKEKKTFEPLLRRLREKNIQFDLVVYASDGAEKFIIHRDGTITVDDDYNRPFTNWESRQILDVIRTLDRRIAQEQGLRTKGIPSFIDNYKNAKYSWSPYGKRDEDVKEYEFEKRPNGGDEYTPARKTRKELGDLALAMLAERGITDIECIVSGKTTAGFVRKGVSKRKAMIDILKDGAAVYFGDEVSSRGDSTGNDNIVGRMLSEGHEGLAVVSLDEPKGDLPPGVLYIGKCVEGTIDVLRRACAICEEANAEKRLDMQNIRSLFADYDIGVIGTIYPLKLGHGIHAPFFIAEAEKGKFILRHVRNDLFKDPQEAARAEVWTVNTAIENGIPFARLIPRKSKNGLCEEDNFIDTDGKGTYYLLYEFKEGETGAFGEKFTEERFDAMIDTLADMHRLFAKHKPPYMREYSLPSILAISENADHLKRLEESIKRKKEQNPKYIYTRAERLVLENADFLLRQYHLLYQNLGAVYGDLPKVMIHADYHPPNVIFQGDEIAAIIDLEHMREEARIYDLAPMVRIGTDEGRFNLENAKRLLFKYHERNPLTANEIAVIPEIFRGKLLDRVSRLLAAGRHYESMYFDFTGIEEGAQSLAMIDKNDKLFLWYQNLIMSLRDLDGRIVYGDFRREIQDVLAAKRKDPRDIIGRHIEEFAAQKKSVRIPTRELGTFSLAALLKDARPVQDLYAEDKGLWKKDGNFYWNHIDPQKAWYRLMAGEEVIFATDKVIVYRSRSGNIYIALRGDAIDRVKKGLDLAKIEINIKADGTVSAVNMLPTSQLDLSRSSIAVQLTDSGLCDKYPVLEELLQYQLVWQGVDGGLRHRELMDSYDIHIELINRALASPRDITEDEVSNIAQFRYFKTKVIRRKALAALTKLYESGKISESEFSLYVNDFIAQDIGEDLRVIERAIKNDDNFVKDAFENLFGLPGITINDLSAVEAEYYGQGDNKEIYKIRFVMKDGSVRTAAVSLIRHDTINEEYGLSEGDITRSIGLWKEISRTGIEGVARYGSDSWERDYRYKDVIIGGTTEKPMKERFVNNIAIVVRGFVEGQNLQEFLDDQRTGPRAKEAAIDACRKLCEEVYESTRQKFGKGYFAAMPHPRQFIIQNRGRDGFKATLAETDNIVDYPSLEVLRNAFEQALPKKGKAKTASVADDPHTQDEPLIGHGFTAEELDKVPVQPWSEFEGFRKAVDEIEVAIKTRAPDKLRALLLDALRDFREGRQGIRMGVIQSYYRDSAHYYLGFGSAKSIGIGREFLNANNPLSEHAVETIFHELFHAARDRVSESAPDDIEADIVTHFEALRLQAQLFWGLSEAEAGWITLKDLENHPNNRLGRAIRMWKDDQKIVPDVISKDNWKGFLRELRGCLSDTTDGTTGLFLLLNVSDDILKREANHPIESRYSILRAVTLLNREEQERLVHILSGNENMRRLAIVDSILLMLKDEMPGNWLSQWAPGLKNRRTWQVSSEIYNLGGGLGRVMQFHGFPMDEFLKKGGGTLCHVEPDYKMRRDSSGNLVEIDYSSLPVPIIQKEEIGRSEVEVGDHVTEAIFYRGINEAGREIYFIGDKDSYYTKVMYNYNTPDNPVKFEEFAAFFSDASLRLINLVEERERNRSPDQWKPPAIHLNDGQCALAPLFRKIYCGRYPLLGAAMVAFTTHTYPNRGEYEEPDGKGILSKLKIPNEYWGYFFHTVEAHDIRGWKHVVDFTSAGIRTADWIGGVSAKHVDDVTIFDDWAFPDDRKIIAVTNGDMRNLTAGTFRKIMLELFPDADVEHPAPAQVLETKKEAKRRIGLDPERPVISYSGRLVWEKAGAERAFIEDNITELVKSGAQVVIYGNVQYGNNYSNWLADRWGHLMWDLNSRGYPGKFVFVPNFDINMQRGLLAATDIQVQDSNHKTEAAGYTEADVSSCGGLQLAPPWREGILQGQGVRINLEVPGEGNTLIPEDGRPESYLKVLKEVLQKRPRELAEYQANSIRLSRVLEARLTAAEYLRQFSRAIDMKSATGGYPSLLPEGVKGSAANALKTVYNNPSLIAKTDISVERHLLPERQRDDGMHRTTVFEEARLLRALGILVDGTEPHTYQLRAGIRDLSPPEIERICSIEINGIRWLKKRGTIPDSVIPALRKEIETIAPVYDLQTPLLSPIHDYIMTIGRKLFEFPTYGANFRAMVGSAPAIDDFYLANPRGCVRTVHGSKTVYMFGTTGTFTVTGPDDVYRIIRYMDITTPGGEDNGSLLIYYEKATNSIVVSLQGPGLDRPVFPGSDNRRGDVEWDKATVRIYLDKDFNVTMLDHELGRQEGYESGMTGRSEMGLSRAMIAIMLEDAGLHREFPALYDSLSAFLVLPEVTGFIRRREVKDNEIVPLSLLERVNRDPAKATDEDIRKVEDFRYYKSWLVKQYALNALAGLLNAGRISGERFEYMEKIFVADDVNEDMKFLQRLLIQDPDLAREAIEGASGAKVSRDDLRGASIQWFDRGSVKNVYYEMALVLKDGRVFPLAASTIRNRVFGVSSVPGKTKRAGAGGGRTGDVNSPEQIKRANEYWKQLSDKGYKLVPKFYASRQVFDHRPRIADRDVAPSFEYPEYEDAEGRLQSRDADGLGRRRWIYNNITIVFREFVEGRDLGEILGDGTIPPEEKEEATRVAIQAYLDLWNDSEALVGKKLFIGDPKPKNVVLRKTDGKYTARLIDFDDLRECDGPGTLEAALRSYREYDDFGPVYSDGKMTAAVKKDHKVFTGAEKEETGLLNTIASLPELKNRLGGTEGERTAALRGLLIKTNAGGYYRSRGEAPLAVMLKGEFGKALGLADEDMPLYYTVTAIGRPDLSVEANDGKSILPSKVSTDLARDMKLKNPVAEVFFDGGKTFLFIDGDNYIAVTAVYGDRELFEKGWVMAKGGVRIKVREGSSTTEEDVYGAVEGYIKAFTDLGTLGISRMEGPDMRPRWKGADGKTHDMNVEPIMDRIYRLGEEAEKDLARPLLPFTTGGDSKKGHLSHDEWRMTSLSTIESICALLENGGMRERFSLTPDGPNDLLIQGFGEVGSNIIRVLRENRERYERYNFRVVGISDAYGAFYNKDGLDMEELYRLAEAREAGREFAPGDYPNLVGNRLDTIDEMLFKPATILIPAGPSYVIKDIATARRLNIKVLAPAANAIIGSEGASAVEVRAIEELLLGRGIVSMPSWLNNIGGIAGSKEQVIHTFTEGGLDRMVNGVKRGWLKRHILNADITDVARINIYWALHLWQRGGYQRPMSEIMGDVAGRMLAEKKRILMSNDVPATLEEKVLMSDSATTKAKASVLREDLDADLPQLRGRLADKSVPVMERAIIAYMMGRSGDGAYADDLIRILEDDTEQSDILYRNAGCGLGYLLEESAHKDRARQVVTRLNALSVRISGAAVSDADTERKMWIEWALRRIADQPLTMDSLAPADMLLTDSMESINKIDLEWMPSLETKETLWHVISIDLIPFNIRNDFMSRIRGWNGVSREKIVVMTERQTPEEMAASIKSEAAGKGLSAKIDFALAREGEIDKLPEGVRALVFEPEGGIVGDFVQLEGILASLRALHIDDYKQKIEKLTLLYELMAGEALPQSKIPAESASVKEFARIFKFILPRPAPIDPKDLKILNERLLEFIQNA